jgi:hypothetical protein
MFLKEAISISAGSIITFDLGYVDYAQYESFSGNSIWYLTRLKGNAIDETRKKIRYSLKRRGFTFKNINSNSDYQRV